MRVPRRLLVLLLLGLPLALLPLGPAQAAIGNGLVAYTCGSDVCVVNPGSTRTDLIPNATDPVWSPNGGKLAWVDTTTGGIKDQSVSGGALTGTVATAATDHAKQPTWSSDGLRLAYVNTSTDDIWVADADGTNAVVVMTTAAAESDPAWSPDGSTMAYVAPDAGGHDQIFTVDLDFTTGTASGTPSQLTSDAVGDNRHPNWSSDSNTIVFSSTREGGVALLYSMAWDGNSQARLGITGIAGDMPAFSPDQTKLVYAVSAGASGAGTLKTVAASGSGSSTTIDSATTNADPDWQVTTSSGGSSSGPPVNTAYPSVNLPFGSTSTIPMVGQVLSTSVGSWSGTFPITYTYQWKQCDAGDALNGPCIDIKGATSSILTVPVGAYGKRLRVQVTATNSSGTAAQNSLATEVVSAVAPHLRVTPPIVGQNMVSQTLSVGTGTWDGSSPLTFTYSWRRCDPFGTLATCVQIPGATAATYVPTLADIGAAIRVYITATNVAGTETDFTNHTFPIVDRPHFAPTATAKPTISASPAVGLPALGTAGTFAGDQPIGTSLQWWRCDATGAACHHIIGETKLQYTPTLKDVGYTLRLTVTAKNAYGTLVAQSDPSEPLAAPAPHLRGRRIVGTARNDYLFGTPGDDVISGLGRNDTIIGNGGYDRINGGPGNDVITVSGPGNSRVVGGSGSDTIYAANGFKDVIDCGAGNDRAVVDSFDVVRKSCEVVQAKTAP